MTQEERLDYLIDFFKKESIEYQKMEVVKEDRKQILRSLMNIRLPNPVPDQILNIQNAYLKEEVRRKGFVSLKEISTIREQYQSKHPIGDKISIWQGDITRLSVDAIVNAANSQMLGCFVPCHKCIDNAIHFAAGIELREECNHYMIKMRSHDNHYEEPTGSAMITSAYNLPCNYVIHTVGPIVQYRLTDDLRQDLISCYESCLKTALENGIRSLAFCCISTGEFHFPNDESAKIAVRTVTEFLNRNTKEFDRIIFNVFKNSDKEIYEKLVSI